MVLLVREGCNFCENLPKVPGMIILTVISTGRGMKCRTSDGEVVELPVHLVGLPTLVDGPDILIGKKPILERLQKKAQP